MYGTNIKPHLLSSRLRSKRRDSSSSEGSYHGSVASLQSEGSFTEEGLFSPTRGRSPSHHPASSLSDLPSQPSTHKSQRPASWADHSTHPASKGGIHGNSSHGRQDISPGPGSGMRVPSSSRLYPPGSPSSPVRKGIYQEAPTSHVSPSKHLSGTSSAGRFNFDPKPAQRPFGEFLGHPKTWGGAKDPPGGVGFPHGGYRKRDSMDSDTSLASTASMPAAFSSTRGGLSSFFQGDDHTESGASSQVPKKDNVKRDRSLDSAKPHQPVQLIQTSGAPTSSAPQNFTEHMARRAKPFSVRANTEELPQTKQSSQQPTSEQQQRRDQTAAKSKAWKGSKSYSDPTKFLSPVTKSESQDRHFQVPKSAPPEVPKRDVSHYLVAAHGGRYFPDPTVDRRPSLPMDPSGGTQLYSDLRKKELGGGLVTPAVHSQRSSSFDASPGQPVYMASAASSVTAGPSLAAAESCFTDLKKRDMTKEQAGEDANKHRVSVRKTLPKTASAGSIPSNLGSGSPSDKMPRFEGRPSKVSSESIESAMNVLDSAIAMLASVAKAKTAAIVESEAVPSLEDLSSASKPATEESHSVILDSVKSQKLQAVSKTKPEVSLAKKETAVPRNDQPTSVKTSKPNIPTEIRSISPITQQPQNINRISVSSKVTKEPAVKPEKYQTIIPSTMTSVQRSSPVSAPMSLDKTKPSAIQASEAKRLSELQCAQLKEALESVEYVAMETVSATPSLSQKDPYVKPRNKGNGSRKQNGGSSATSTVTQKEPVTRLLEKTTLETIIPSDRDVTMKDKVLADFLQDVVVDAEERRRMLTKEDSFNRPSSPEDIPIALPKDSVILRNRYSAFKKKDSTSSDSASSPPTPRVSPRMKRRHKKTSSDADASSRGQKLLSVPGKSKK